MYQQKQLRKQLGDGYRFCQRLSSGEAKRLLSQVDGGNHFQVAASLTAGVVKLEAVMYWNNGRHALGYDLMVKDSPDSPDWICYESLAEEVRYSVRNLEREMFQVLNRAVEQYGLSYTECRFPKVDGSKKEP